MAKITINVKVGFTGKIVLDKDDLIEMVESACECLRDEEAPAYAKTLAQQVLIAGLEDGLEGVAKFKLRYGIRNYIKYSDDLDVIANKSPAMVTFR